VATGASRTRDVPCATSSASGAMAPTRMHVNSDSSLLDDVFVLLALG
jgi:hypothetical protein